MSSQYIIIYGYDPNITFDIIKKYTTKKIIIVDPFIKDIDYINKLQTKFNIKWIKKLFITDNKLQEINIYEQENLKYSFEKPLAYLKKHNIFTTSLENIIDEFEIDNIFNIYININVSNLKNLLNKWIEINHLIERITLPIMINQEILHNLFFENYDENISIKDNDALDFYYMHYTHKDLKRKTTNIILYNISNQKSEIINDRYNKFKKKYNILEKNVDNKNKNVSVFLHERLIENLTNIFENEKDINNIDIIIQFNSEYYDKYKFFKLIYPINDAILYVNDEYGIIYSTKNCMHMLYEILKSNYFKEFIEDEKSKRKKLFKIFYKRLFYEYIQKIFKINYI
jgi:hypothetical protein